jgi:glycosyltransferase involved in cell wall biosynthesis
LRIRFAIEWIENGIDTGRPEMKLSIIIPFHNAQQYLGECLETVSACPSDEMECILVDDGSTDSSLEICKSFMRRDSRFRTVSQKNLGVSAARNMGIMHARAESIFFLDADDCIVKEKWYEILKAAEEGFDFVAFSHYTLWEDGSLKEELFPFKGRETSDIQMARMILLATARFNTCWGKLFKRGLITQYGICFKNGVKTGEDTIFVLDYFLAANSYSIRNISILFYRQHKNSVMHKTNMEKKLDDFQTIYDYRSMLAQKWKDPVLEREMYRQLFSIITDMFLKYAATGTVSESREAFRDAFKRDMVQMIIQNTPFVQLSPRYKKIEYLLMKGDVFDWLVRLMKIKVKLARFL